MEEEKANMYVNKNIKMTIDGVLEKIGFGFWQIILLIAFCYIHISFCYQTLIMYYAGDNPPWKCSSNTTSVFCKNNFGRAFEESGDDFYKRCDLKRNEWKFTSSKDFSIVTEYDLVCSQEYLDSLINALFFIGWGLCGLFTGVFSDKYGRKITMVLCLFSTCLFAIISSFVSAVWQLGVLRFILGGVVGTMTSGLFIYVSEITSPKYRSLCMNILQVFYSVSLILLTVLARTLKNWRHLELYAAVPSALGFIILLFLPESPRWYQAVGKITKAESMLKKLAQRNKKHISFSLSDVKSNEECERKYSYIDFFRKLSIALFVLVQAYLWLTSGLVYYGLSMESSDLGGDIYDNFMLSMIADIVGNTLAVFACNLLGRRKTVIISFAFCGIILGCIDAVPKSYRHGVIIRIGFAMIGKVFINLAFSGLYIWSSELYPTVVRTQGLTLCQIGARIGSSAAPFVSSSLRSVYQPLPFIIMASCSILASLAAFYLPETYQRPSREEFENILNPSLTIQQEDIEPLLN